MTVAEILMAARAAGVTIATAESCTGGMVAAALTDVAGASDVVMGGVVSYSNAAKTALLGVDPAMIAAHGAVSEPVARQMAEGAMARFAAVLSVSVTGIAGPGGSEWKPEGRVCFGLAHHDRPTVTETIDFEPLGRAAVREASRDHALLLLARALS